MSELVSVSSPEEENLWEDLNTGMFFHTAEAASALLEVAFFFSLVVLFFI